MPSFVVDAPGWRQADIDGSLYNYKDGRILTADLNGDGKSDLVRVMDNRIESWFGRSDGSFMQGAPLVFSSDPQGRVEVDLGDFDGDGHPDLVVGKSGTADDVRGRVWIFWNDGAGAFNPSTRYEVAGPVAFDGMWGGPSAVSARDVDQDGRADLSVYAVANYMGQVFLHGSGARSVPFDSSNFRSSKVIVRDWVRGDVESPVSRPAQYQNVQDEVGLDSDGSLHLATGYRDNQKVVYSTIRQDALGKMKAFALLDFDGDGLDDIVISPKDASGIRVSSSAGAESIRSSATVMLADGLRPSFLGRAKVGSTGRPSLLAVFGSSVYVLRAEDVGARRWLQVKRTGSQVVPAYDGGRAAVIADFDGDGNDDLAVVGVKDNRWKGHVHVTFGK